MYADEYGGYGSGMNGGGGAGSGNGGARFGGNDRGSYANPPREYFQQSSTLSRFGRKSL